MRKIYTPLTEKCIKSLKVKDEVLLDGVIYTARDQVHQELVKVIREHKKLPFSLSNQVIYYCGPTFVPSKAGNDLGCNAQSQAVQKKIVIGSCGPTTSARMDAFTLDLLKMGLKGMIGKGQRAEQVRQAIKKYQAVYFLTLAGCGALLSTKVRKANIVAYKSFGPEAIYKLEVEDFPLIVGIDAQGKDIYGGK